MNEVLNGYLYGANNDQYTYYIMSDMTMIYSKLGRNVNGRFKFRGPRGTAGSFLPRKRYPVRLLNSNFACNLLNDKN